MRKLGLFAYFVTQVQKSFRGYYSRKYRQNHASRKHYIKTILLAGEDLRKQTQSYNEKLSKVDIKILNICCVKCARMKIY